MSKTRSDSAWGTLAPKQRKQLDQWFFEENLGYKDMRERAKKEFGVKTSWQSLANYFRRRKAEREQEPEGAEEMTPELRDMKREIEMKERPGGNMDPATLELMMMRHVALAAYKISLAEPEKLRVTELQRLVKMLGEHKAQALRREAMAHAQQLDEYKLLDKVTKGRGKTMEEIKKMAIETAKLLRGLKASLRAEIAAEKAAETGLRRRMEILKQSTGKTAKRRPNSVTARRKWLKAVPMKLLQTNPLRQP